MAKIFISYSRKNIDFAKRLTGALEQRGMDFWVDWEGIPPTVDWMNEIQRGIEEADTFLFIISPDSVKSTVCKKEIDIATRNGKRLIPIVAEEVAWNDTPPELSHLNYIFFRKTDDFDSSLGKLVTAIDTDYGWVQTHRRLQVKALEWERSNKDSGFLLRGKDLEDAESQILVNANKSPHITDIQSDYILASRQATNRQKRIFTGGLISAIVVLLGIIVTLAYPSVAEWWAQQEARGELIPIPGGDFYMGATDPTVVETGERGKWVATLPAFYIDKYEVTNQQYKLCVEHGGCTPPGNPQYFRDPDMEEYPVLNVTVYQANFYCQWLDRRLPTELEWVRAARGLNDQRFWPWGKTEPNAELANMPLDLEMTTSGPQLSINPSMVLGESPEQVQNMIGNALEWTSSYYQAAYYQQGADYDYDGYWNGSDETFESDRSFVRLGGGWQRRIYHLTQATTETGLGTDSNTGMRCASDSP